MLTLLVWLCVLTLGALCLSLCPGRVSLTRGASLLVEELSLEDEGWFECRILLLDCTTDEFRNGTWTFLSITGAAQWDSVAVRGTGLALTGQEILQLLTTINVFPLKYPQHEAGA